MKKLLLPCLLLAVVLSGCSFDSQTSGEILGLEEAKAKAEDFINENLMNEGGAVVEEISIEDGLYKVSVNIGTGENVFSYLSKDGQRFYPQALNVAEIEAQKEAALAEQAQAAEAPKTDKPVVEVFVMSHCPYGTQMEKGILPVVETLGDKINFELKFCDYAMHGQPELNEQLKQHCLKEQGQDKLINYLKCFLADESKGDACLQTVGVDQNKLDNCISQTDNEFEVTKNFNDGSSWKGSYPSFPVYQEDVDKYAISGSPALVINEKKISVARDPATLLQTICGAFNSEPEECQTVLSSATPAPGFGSDLSDSGSTGTCQ